MEERDWLTKEEAMAFIGDGTDFNFYLDKWKMHSGSFWKGWNWSAWFFSVEWMAYRKMYTEAALAYLFIFAVSFLLAVLFPSLNESVPAFAIRLAIGLFGNTLYRNKAFRVLKRTRGMQEEERLHVFAKAGGVSKLAVGVIIGIELVLNALPLLLLRSF